MTEHGEEKAEALGLQLSVVRFDVVLSSPMQRALQTAELAGFDAPRVTPLLREVDYGDYEGLTTDQIHRTNPGWELYRDGSPGGETPAEIARRAAEFIDLVTSLKTHRALAFAHGHILRAIAATWIAAPITVAAGLQLDPATINVLRDGDRGRVIGQWNSG